MLPRHIAFWLLAVICAGQARIALAQLDIIKQLTRPPEARQNQFAGYAQLAAAVEQAEQAEQGDISASLQSVKTAFQKGGAKTPLNDPDGAMIAQQLLKLSMLWRDRNAPPEDVAAFLIDVVIPPKEAGPVFLYPAAWSIAPNESLLSQPQTKLLAVNSVGAELVRWAVAARKTTELHKRLAPKLKSTKGPVYAWILAVQLAVAEGDSATAVETLKALKEEVPKLGAERLEVLCHAVMPAVRDQQAEEASLQLFEALLNRADELPQETSLKTGSIVLRLELARRHIQAGRLDDAVRLAKLAAEMPLNARRYGNNYAEHLRQVQREYSAAVLLEAGVVKDALDLLGPQAEVPVPLAFRYQIRPNITAMLGRALQKLPAEERLVLLSDWALPGGAQSAWRDLSEFVPGVGTPDTGAIPRCGLLGDIYSTSWHLLTTAEELGKLDDVLQNLAIPVDQSPRLRTVRLLGAVLREDTKRANAGSRNRMENTTGLLRTLLEETAKNVPKWEDQDKAPFPMLTFVTASEAARNPDWRPLALSLMERLLEHTKLIQWDRPRAHVRLAHLELLRMRETGNTPQPAWTEWAKMQPKHWGPLGIQSAVQHANGSLPDVWCASEGALQHLTGPYDSDLSFEFPLTGRFEISFDCRDGAWSEGYAGYGGVQLAVNAYNDTAFLFGKGRVGHQNGPSMGLLLNKEPWNRYTIQVDGDVVTYRANGQIVHEDRPGLSAPWITLGADWGRTPTFRNFRFTGSPVIPREVSLISDVRLRGWIATHFSESQRDPIRGPQRYVQVMQKVNGQNTIMLVEADASNADQAIEMPEPEADWMFREGELRSSQRASFWPKETESWMYYQRPLRDGDQLRYEFYFEPGLIEAAPTIGRTAYVWSSEGVTRHRITDGAYEVLARSPADNVLEPKLLTLRERDWNVVEIELQGDDVTIALNGMPAVTEKIGPTADRRFGFFHDASRTSLQVRNAVLSGNWPQSFEEPLRQAIEWPEPVELLPSTRFLGIEFNEEYISDNAFEIYRRALGMEAVPRYEFLHRWVMPNTSHDLLRMAGAFTPKHPSPVTLADHPIDVATAEARQAVAPRRIQTGGNFVCPAILLVLAAMETDRIDELQQEILQHPPGSSPEMARNRSAILGIIALLQDRVNDANDALWECSRLIVEKEHQSQFVRWGDVALASLAIQHPDTQPAALELLDRIRKRHLQNGQPGSRPFELFVRQLHDQARYLMSGGPAEEFGAPLSSRQWQAVPQPCAKSRGNGVPISAFDTFTGDLALRGGDECDTAYFQSPLRGDYEVTCRLTQFDFQEAMLMAAGIANNLSWKYDTARVLHVRSRIVETPTPQPITPKPSHGFDYKIVVRNGRYTSYVNGQELYQAELPEQPDPWLAMVGWGGNSGRYARHIQITGNPEIPDELDLLAPPDLKGWITDYYGSWTSDSPYPWTCQDGVLACEQKAVANSTAGRLKLENIIRYHRPFLEDGEIAYEFYYDPTVKRLVDDPTRQTVVNGRVQNAQREVPGQLLVSPALDRLVCLLEPDGVKLHWLTDGRFERTGLLPDNAEPYPPPDDETAQRGEALPLKVKAWNTVKCAVQQDELIITLNGKTILQREIEPTNLRQFGLFHYVNESGVRVRNIRYRGDWPKRLPPVAEQELAAGPERLAISDETVLPQSRLFNFTNSWFEAAEFGHHWDTAAAMKQIQPYADGLKFDLPAGKPKPQYAGLHPRLELAGDFSVTIDYEGLKTVTSGENWGAGLEFKAQINYSSEAGLQAREWAGGKAWRAVRLHATPVKDYSYNDETTLGFAPAGRVRLQRRGPVLYHFIAKPGSNEFQFVAQRPVGTSDITHILIEAVAADEASGAEFVLKSLTIYAEQIRKK